MALKVELKPNERIIIGESLIKNDNQRTRLFIEGEAPILREKDIVTAQSANTPAKKIYLTLQIMYLENDIEKHKETYLQFVEDFIEAAPSLLPIIKNINNKVLTGELYKSLKEAKKLIILEKERLDYAISSSTSLQPNKSENSQST